MPDLSKALFFPPSPGVDCEKNFPFILKLPHQPSQNTIGMRMLTKKDIQHLRSAIMGEMLAYLGHASRGHLKPGRETEHLAYLKGLSDRLDAAEKTAALEPGACELGGVPKDARSGAAERGRGEGRHLAR